MSSHVHVLGQEGSLPVPLTKHSQIHIGFLARDFLKWGGGVWFIQNLLRGLATVSPMRVRITVLVPSNRTVRHLVRRVASSLKRGVLHPKHAWKHTFGSWAAEDELWVSGTHQLAAIAPHLTIFDGSDADLVRQCSELGIDVLLPVMTPLLKSSIPWVGYLYDCQHKHFPEFFSEREIVHRDAAFASMLRQGLVVFANAEAVITDLSSFFPDLNASLHALPFAPMIYEVELCSAIRDSQEAQQRFTGGAPYFIVCNQFWIHKDHATALRAFAIFTQLPTRHRWRLVCTGSKEDFRTPGYFDELMALVSELGIAERVVFTGYLERSLQQALLYGAAALIQPTRFEGGPGGGAVFDAIALGIPCLISDITVNRELADPLASFFAVGDPASLSIAMENVVAEPPVRPTAPQLLDSSRDRAILLGETLLTLAERAIASSNAS